MGVVKSLCPSVMIFLEQGRAKGRQLEAVEQMLDVKRMDPLVLERMAKAILRKNKKEGGRVELQVLIR